MSVFKDQIQNASDLTIEEQKKAGTPVAGSIGDEHRDFLKTLKAMLESGEIDPEDPQSLLKQDVYEQLDEQWKEKADLALQNITSQLSLIAKFIASPETPNESLQLQTMVEQLWQAKQRIEEHFDVFKF